MLTPQQRLADLVANAAPITVAELHQEREAALATMVWLARRGDVNTFCELVLKDEATGASLQQAPVHEEWHLLAEEHKRLVLWSSIEMGKTTQLAIGRTLHKLGQNPNARIAVVSNTHEQAVKIVRTISRIIERSAEFRAIYPDVHADPRQPWRQNFIYLERSNPNIKEPSLQAFGVHGNVLGARLDGLILDDILDYENTRTPAARDDLWDWYHATLAGRLTRDAWVLVTGNAHHPDDFMHRLARHPAWHSVRYPAILPGGGPAWPERWSAKRLAEKRVELGPQEFARQLLCAARDDEEARFKRGWIEACRQAAYERGIRDFTEALDGGCPPGFCVSTGVDLGVGRKASNDLTTLFTVLTYPNHDREVLEVQAGRWTAQEIIAHIKDVHTRYGSLVWVENNGAQDYLVQFLWDQGIPVHRFTTGRNKVDPQFGVASLAAELEATKWLIPTLDGEQGKQIDAWVEELLYYSPDAHTGDRVMASWIAREGARLTMAHYTAQQQQEQEFGTEGAGATLISV
jgi:hypothetical protein